ncbi:uncharacterized protein LOC130734247 [Lotus japonicus]|uniref:uncharacterized protein LOC130734247 n=1 Tax=Lotus japonicus TaxID=34305 RepID=UPI0025861AE8|nr:uncharacterized protein LOC130734247 [Lotus japonicus]
MGHWVNGIWCWNFEWRRAILPREEGALKEFHSFLQQVNLVEGREDKWIWNASEEGSYIVKSAFSVLQGLELEEPILVFRALWQGTAPSNVLAFGWRVFWGRLQTQENMLRRGIIPIGENTSCLFCHEVEETPNHLLFNCFFSYQVWTLCYRWLGALTAFPESSSLHFLQFGNEFRTLKQQGVMKTVWLAISWSVWLHRNKILFKNDQKDAAKVVELAQLRAWNWLRARNKSLTYSVFDWISQPRICIESF